MLKNLMESNTAFENMDKKAVRVMEVMTGMKIEREDEEETVNVRKRNSRFKISGVEAET